MTDSAEKLLREALPILQDFARHNPLHEYYGKQQDPMGIHDLLPRIRAHLATPAQAAEVNGVDYKERWLDLIMQVGNKYPGESRHDTAKRYIIAHENRHDNAAKSAAPMTAASGMDEREG